LSTYVSFPIPWYLPTITLFALITITSVFDQLLERARSSTTGRRNPITRIGGWLIWIAAGMLAAGALSIFIMAAHQLRWQQELIEDGQRRKIGLWLKEQVADQNETVFLEPLGYIGFYSNLKMLDYPGLSSPEVIAARKRASSRAYPDCWPEMILDLMPNWIVLRSYEADTIRRLSPDVLNQFYSLARIFDVRETVTAIENIAGRHYLLNDAYFEVYRRKAEYGRTGQGFVGLRPINSKNALTNDSWGEPAYDSGSNLVTHAPSRLVFKLPAGARRISGEFGIFDGAYRDNQNSTDGAVFSITLISSDGVRQELLQRALNPRENITDRSRQSVSIAFPAMVNGSVEFATSPGPSGSNAFDWTFWSSLSFEFPHSP
jgi:hypothetical protein